MLLDEKVYVQVHAIQFIFTKADICRDVGAGGLCFLSPLTFKFTPTSLIWTFNVRVINLSWPGDGVVITYHSHSEQKESLLDSW